MSSFWRAISWSEEQVCAAALRGHVEAGLGRISLQHDLQSALTLPQLSLMAASGWHSVCIFPVLASCSGLAASLTHSCPSAVVQLEDRESLVIPEPSTLLQWCEHGLITVLGEERGGR